VRPPIDPLRVWRTVRDAGKGEAEPLVVAGARGPAGELRRLLAAGGDLALVRDASGRDVSEGDLAGAGALVLVLEAGAGDRDERALRLAARRGLGLVAVAAGAAEPPRLPYVLAADVVAAPDGVAGAFDAIAERVAARAGDRAHALAARLPALRRPLAEAIVRETVRRNAILSAAIFVPGADLPVLTLNQVRMVARIAAAYGRPVDTRERALEAVAVVLAGLGFRGLARTLVSRLPGPAFLWKAGVAAAGTKAVGEAAVAAFEGRR
jgi:uncharacterized protein (DUF697 family)